MTATQAPATEFGEGQILDKGLKSGALGLVSSVAIGVASTAPAYSLAATLGFVALLAGTQTVIVVILAFVPIFLVSFGYKELNRAEPDCGTTFTWATKAFGPKSGWLGGWGIIAADILVMASLAQVAGQYFFLLVGATASAPIATSAWVLLVGVIWIVVMTAICYVGIEISAELQKTMLVIEVVMLVIFSITALVKAYGSNPPAGSAHISGSWFDPTQLSFSHFVQAILLMLFIYWGWDSAVSVNEETADKERTPGRAAVISTILLVAIYVLVAVAVVSFAGVGDKGNGLTNAGQLQRRHQHPGLCGVRRPRLRSLHGQAAGLHGAHLGRGLDADHDPADRPYLAVHGRLPGHPQGVRQDPPEVPDAQCLDPHHGWHLDRALPLLQLRVAAATSSPTR